MTERQVVAAPWTPQPWLAGPDGLVRPEFIWTALDCPGGWAIVDHAPGRLALLGRICAEVTRRLSAGERYVVVGWPLGAEGRKLCAGTAIFSDGGRLCAAAFSTWIKIDRA